MKKTRTIIEISPKTIIMVLVILLALAFIFYVRDVVFLVLFAVMFSAAIDEPIDWLNRRGVPRWLGVLFIYLVVIGLFSVTIALIIPPIVTETQSLFSALPSLFERAGGFLSSSGIATDQSKIDSIVSTIGNSIFGSSKSFLSTLTGIFGGFVTIALILVMTFYLVVQENGLKRLIRSLVPVRHQPYVTSLTNRIQFRIGQWFRGQITLALVIGVISYIALRIIGVPYAFVLAIFAGLMEVVPYIGPIIAAIPAAFLVIDNPVKALIVIGAYVLINQLENHILVPRIMQKAVGLNAVVIIVALLIGGKIAGLIGIILAIPVATAISEFASDFLQNRREEVKRQEEKEVAEGM